MTVEQIKLVRYARPFRPFTIHMADGQSIHVPHPDFIASSPSGRTISVAATSDAFSIIDLLLVNRIEVHATAETTAAGSNGQT